ncbi:hypothetical protein P4U99_19730 [Brevibacillus agri]|uniref:hypothetical protein n=1 Tax=Brevibacillus agri TaxID=51101 RepID=UPI002E1C1153|nr:hypothetical protein [Brevibacillus agri]MED1655217.1 hypothetical protein [Brevibacillus agri]MED1687217.1 hypothetical protein [Brevibacillus agri]MED1693278.1 hypothetical protein [Brevibacillus agri]MED1699472.1 hypothetical protein [Brevibacillus agri]
MAVCRRAPVLLGYFERLTVTVYVVLALPFSTVTVIAAWSGASGLISSKPFALIVAYSS